MNEHIKKKTLASSMTVQSVGGIFPWELRRAHLDQQQYGSALNLWSQWPLPAYENKIKNILNETEHFRWRQQFLVNLAQKKDQWKEFVERSIFRLNDKAKDDICCRVNDYGRDVLQFLNDYGIPPLEVLTDLDDARAREQAKSALWKHWATEGTFIIASMKDLRRKLKSQEPMLNSQGRGILRILNEKSPNGDAVPVVPEIIGFERCTGKKKRRPSNTELSLLVRKLILTLGQSKILHEWQNAPNFGLIAALCTLAFPEWFRTRRRTQEGNSSCGRNILTAKKVIRKIKARLNAPLQIDLPGSEVDGLFDFVVEGRGVFCPVLRLEWPCRKAALL